MAEYDELLKVIKDTLEKIHKSIEAITAQQNTSERAKQINVHIDSQVDIGLPVEVSEYYRSEQSEREPKNRRDRIKLGLEIVGVITAIILAAFTIKTFLVLRGQLKEMRSQTTILRNQADQATRDAAFTRTQTDQQIQIAKDQFRLDQRPVIWLANDQDANRMFQLVQVVPPNGPRQIFITLRYFNFGKSPAYRLKDSRSIVIGEKAPDKIKGKPIPTQQGALLPNGKEDFLTIVSDPLKDGDLPNIGKADWVSFFLRFKYEDSVGNTYESDICMSHLQTGSYRFCDKGNDIKDCAKVRCEN